MDLLTSMPPKAESLTYLLPNTISVKNLNKLINNHGKDKYMNNKSPFSTTMAQMLYVTAHTTLILLPLNLLTLRPKYSSSDSKDHKKYSLTNIFKILSEKQINLQVNMKISQKNIILVGSNHLHHSQTRERIQLRNLSTIRKIHCMYQSKRCHTIHSTMVLVKIMIKLMKKRQNSMQVSFHHHQMVPLQEGIPSTETNGRQDSTRSTGIIHSSLNSAERYFIQLKPISIDILILSYMSDM